MRSLKDIRNSKKRNDLLFSGMESTPKSLPVEFLEYQKQHYQDVVKPSVERVFDRQMNN